MLRLRLLAPLFVVGIFGSSFLMGDDKREPIVVNVRLPYHYNKLGLTPKQVNHVYKIRGKYAAEIQELKQKISDLMEQEKTDCEKVLTAAQKARLQELLGSSNRRRGADDEDEPVKVEKKKGAVAKDQKKKANPKDKNGPAEINK